MSVYRTIGPLVLFIHFTSVTNKAPETYLHVLEDVDFDVFFVMCVERKQENPRKITSIIRQMSHVMRKAEFFLCENKGADQLCAVTGRSAPLFSLQKYPSTIPLFPKSKISSILYQTRLGTPNSGFLTLQLKYASPAL